MPSISSDIANEALSMLVADMTLSPEEEASISDPSDGQAREIDKLKLIVDVLQDHIKSRILSIRRQQNMIVPIIPRQQNPLIPINRLPPELLSKILVDVTDESDPEDCHNDALDLVAVSSLWHVICLSTPRIWCRLSNEMNIELTRLRLERSKEVPLHVTHELHWQFEDEKPFLDMVTPHMARWKSFLMCSYNLEELSQNYLAGKHFPLLEDLTLWSAKKYEFQIHTQLVSLNISASSLRILTAENVPFPLRLEPGLHPNLTYIQFTPCINGASFLPEQYHCLFLSAPNLEHITIKGAIHSQAPMWQIDDMFQVQLRNLQKIRFIHLPWIITYALISSIISPPGRHLDCWITTPPILEHPPIPFPRTPRPHSLMAKIRTSDRISVTLKHQRFGDRAPYLEVCFALGLKPLLALFTEHDNPSPSAFLPKLVELGNFLQVRIVELEGVNKFLGGDIHESVSFLLGVEIIRFRSLCFDGKEDATGHEEVVRLLSSSSSLPQGTFQIFPKLNHIALDCIVDEVSLLRLIETRGREADSETDSSGSMCRLEVVEMSEKNESVLNGVQACAAKYNVELRYRDLSDW